MSFRLSLLVAAACTALVVGCSGGGEPQGTTAGVPGTTSSHDGGVVSNPGDGTHAGDGGAAEGASARSNDAGGEAFVEAPHPPAPHILNSGGVVLTHPKFVPVSFDGDPIQSDFDSFLSTIGASSYWSAVTAEYGVGPAVALTPVHVSDAAPTTIDYAGVATWLQGMLDGTHPEFGTPDAGTVYVILYPPQTTTVSCYHSNLQLGSTPVPFAVSAGCGGTDQRLYPVSHELIESATDPFPGQPAYLNIDDADYAYAASTGAYEAEIGDLCQALDTKYATVGNVIVTTAWSNAAALAGHDPCVPNQFDRTYFNAFPVLPDQVVIPDSYGGMHMANGLRIPIGQQKTIELDLFSDGPTSEWTVTALDVNTAQGQPAALTFAFDEASGKNGDKLHLTVSAVGPGMLTGSVAMFFIQSNMGDVNEDPTKQTMVPVVVVNQ